jgi:hypothetical protein
VYSFQSLSPSAASLLAKQPATVLAATCPTISNRSQQFVLNNIPQYIHQDHQSQQQQQLASAIKKKKPVKKYKHIQSRPVELSQPQQLQKQQQQQMLAQPVNSRFEINSSPEDMCLYDDTAPTFLPCIDSLNNSYIQVK